MVSCKCPVGTQVMCMVQKISVPGKWSEEDSICALRRRQSHNGRGAPAVAQPTSLPRKKQAVQGDSPWAAGSEISDSWAPQLVPVEEERESVYSSHLITEHHHQQWKVHLVHPPSAPHAGFPRALSKTLRPQVCQEHDFEGLFVTQ